MPTRAYHRLRNIFANTCSKSPRNCIKFFARFSVYKRAVFREEYHSSDSTVKSKMVFKCVVFVALVAAASAGVISPLGLAAPQIALGGLPIARSGLISPVGINSLGLNSLGLNGLGVNALGVNTLGINNIGLGSPLLRSQVIGPSAISSQQVISSPILRSQILPQQVIAGPQVYGAQQVLAAPQLLRSQIIPQQVIAGPQVYGAQQVLAAPQLLRSQVIPQQLIAAPQVLAAPIARTVAVDNYDPNPQYSFAYDVQDALTGDSKNQQETRNGDVVQGSYSLNDPDGTRRTVDYVADPINGFNAVVRKEPLGVAVKAIGAQVLAASPLGLSSQILG